MKKSWSFMALMVLTVLAACSPRFAVNTDRDASVNLNAYTSFSFTPDEEYLNTSDPILDSPLNRKRIANLIKEELSAKGYDFSEADAHLKVQFFTRAKDRQEVRNMANPNPFFFSRWGFFNNFNNTYVRNYQENTLVINLLDAQTNTLLWQGWAKGEINYSSPKYKDRLAHKVAQILEELAYPGKSAPIVTSAP